MELLGIVHAGTALLTFDDLLVRTAVLVLAVSTTWLLAVVVAVVIEAATLGRLRPARFTGAPAPLRRMLLTAAVGALALFGVGVPAQATGPDRGHAQGASAALEGLPLPDRTLGGLPPEPTGARAHRAVTVRPGDSLWRIAARLLPDADDARLVAATQTLHAHNRAVLGTDPDLLRPGQRLLVPAILTDRTPAAPSLPSTQEHP